MIDCSSIKGTVQTAGESTPTNLERYLPPLQGKHMLTTKLFKTLALVISLSAPVLSSHASADVSDADGETASSQSAGRVLLKVINKTYPDLTMTLTCLDEACENLDSARSNGNGVAHRPMTLESLKLLANRNVDHSQDYSTAIGNGGATAAPYGVTSTFTDGIGNDWKKGNEFAAIAKAPLTIFMVIADTIILPGEVITYASVDGIDHSAGQRRRTARKLLEMIQKGEAVQLKDKQYSQLMSLGF